MPTSRVLRIGREPDNDFVVNLATVSGYHARVTWSGRPGEAIIEDIGSTNGTAVGTPDRRGQRASFTAADTVYLGTYSLPGSQLLQALTALDAQQALRAELTIGAGSIVVGRDSACDRVVDSPVVSGRHARITRRTDGTITVEDLHSANGTFINGRRIEAIGAARPGDTIALGSYSLVLVLDPALAPAVPVPVIPRTFIPAAPIETSVSSLSFGSELVEVWRAAWAEKQWPGFILFLGAVQGISAALAGSQTAEARPALASILSLLGWVALMFGLLVGVRAMVDQPATDGLRRWLATVSVPTTFGVVYCLLAWIVAQVCAGGRLGGAESLLLLLLGSGAGTALGLLIASLAPRPAIAWAAALLLLIPIWIFGGSELIWPKLPGWAKTVAAVNPARWTFEGLMVNASDRLPLQDKTDPPTDLAEPYFPAETERIGPRGAAMALAAMLLGWGVAAAFIATSPRAREHPAGRPVP